MKPKVKFTNISKVYHLYNKQSDKLINIFSSKKKQSERAFYALRDVSFEVFKGETIGIVGINGSGKSTLSNILSEVIPPTSGEMEIDGETSLIAINAGLNNQLTGLENIELKLIMLGFKKDKIKEITPLIIEFADIGQFIEQPIKNYSSGMKSRLGFAISAYSNPDILIVDEALSVGDKTFYKKCLERIDQFKEEGKTIFFISHSVTQMRSVSDRVLWLHHGEVKQFGEANEVLDEYRAFVKWLNRLPKKEKKEYRQDMLKKQTITSPPPELIDLKKDAHGNRLSFIQIVLLFIVTVLSAFFMYIDKSPLAFYDEVVRKEINQTYHEEAELSDATAVVRESIAREGFIANRQVDIYREEDLQTSLGTLEFAASVYVFEQVGNSYKILYQNVEAYIDVNDVAIQEEQQMSNLTLKEAASLFPESFAGSYQFFLAHLNDNYDEVKLRLRGLTNETVDEAGNPILTYGIDGVTYLFNDSGVADRMIIENINVEHALLDDIRTEAELLSSDGQLLYVPTSSYHYIVDKEHNTLQIQTVQSETEQ
jgi:teichoic acid transport system ATP-binding protein